MPEADRSLAIFIDFENLALGIQNQRERFDIVRVLERLVEKGKVVVKKAYADWSRFSNYTAWLHEAAIELIEIPQRRMSGKNSADIRLCVDAMDLAYSKDHINTFVILSGDSDFSPLVSKLKELGKHVIGLGMQQSTSELLRDNCDEFIYYEDLGKVEVESPAIDSHLPEAKRKAFALLLESLLALRRENKDVLWSSMIKDTIKRKKPSFNETYHGYRTFSELLEDAAHHGLLELETDKRSRTYVVRRFGSEMHHEEPVSHEASAPREAAAPAVPGAARETIPMQEPIVASASVGAEVVGQQKKGRRRRRGRGRGEGNGQGPHAPRPGGMVVVPMNPPVEIPRGEPHTPAADEAVEEVLVTPVPAAFVAEAEPEPEPMPHPRPKPERLPQPIPEPMTAHDEDFAAGLWGDIDVPYAPLDTAPVGSVPEVVAPQEVEEPAEPAPAPKKPRGRAPKPAAPKQAKQPASRTRKSAPKEKPTPRTQSPRGGEKAE